MFYNQIQEAIQISEVEAQQILLELNETAVSYPDVLLHQLFEEQAQKTPNATAVLFENQTLTYQELNSRANQLAHYLQSQGVPPDGMVGVCMDRSLEMVIALYAILKAGGAYVPIDPRYPADRIAFIIEDTRIPLLLTQQRWLDMIDRMDVSAPVIAVDTQAALFSQQPNTAPSINLTSDNLAYVIYTSGSTGKPKGAMNSHRGIVNRLLWMQDEYGLTSEDTVLQKTPYSFDVSVWEFFWPLFTGAKLVVAKPEGHKDPSYLVSIIQKHQVTTLHFVPSMLQIFVKEPRISACSSVRRVICSGEALPADLQRRFFTKLPTELHNLYGPTEAAVDVTYWQCDPKDTRDFVPIGKPVANTQIYIVDDKNQPVPIGMSGELLIGGVQVARGYLNRPELTAEKFIADPFCEDDQATLYRTGDLARLLADGSIEYLGRLDFQVKIRGFRIELGEIETCLNTHPAVRQAVVLAREDTPGDKRLAAYLVLNEKHALNISELRHFLLQQLPDYMVPADFVTLDSFPHTSNGKLDRQALPAPQTDRPQLAQSYVAPRTETEKFLASVWAQILKLARVGIEDNFFELGGNSLLNFHVMARIREEKEIDLPVVKLFQYPTIHTLAKYLDQEQSDQFFLYEVIERAEKRVVKRAEQQKTSDIAIIGMALRFPGANNIDELWQVLTEGKATITFFNDDEIDPQEPDEVRYDPNYVKVHGIIDDVDKFDAKFFGMNPRVAQVTDPQHRVFLELAWAALEDAGYDPDQFDGDIGLYAGMGENTYRRKLVEKRPDLMRSVGEFQVMLGSIKDFLTTRVSYKLNLTGPSISMATACSVSLVAIGAAFDGLVNHDCDMAIGGGISIMTPQNIGYLSQEGGIFTREGVCRPFDINATGTMFNNGAGIIVMRRLEDAIADGDQIVAVIKSVGINNDGDDKVSFSAPSVVGQAKAIATAQVFADVAPETISYIEAHGTATPVGDPIEIEALTKAFRARTDKVGYCGIGSIKSNLGHMVAAAGVAGVIKTALALKHKQIPATINFTNPNPELNLEETPFFVVDRLMDWEKGGFPRRAGVSSYGVGGTNAHAILEEAPVQLASGEERPFQVVMLSAKTEEALETMSANLADHLVRHNDLSLADVAHTLQVGRKSFNHRRFAVGQTTADIAAILREDKTVTKHVEQRNPDIVFVFPGQGSQYINMGLDLYDQEPFFKETVDYCAEILTPYLGRDLRNVLYPAAGDEEAAEAILKDTFFTQPALFTIEYALAKLWLSWGVLPSAMIGHSIGEYVAACIAGVFSVEDALKIVALRGRLVREQPAGSMLSVRRPAADVEPQLSGQLALAASNSPRLCVVAGPDEEIAAFETHLQAQNIACKHLHTSHAFHSAMMEPVVAPFAAFVGDVSLSAPNIPIISTVTGAWMRPEEATDPHYWARHARVTVRFAEAVGTAWEVPERVLLEVGPRSTSTTLARQQISDRSVQTAVPSLSDTTENGAEWRALMAAVGQLWQTGVVFEWSAFYAEQRRRRVSLPTYPFARTRFWADPPEQKKCAAAPSSAMPIPVPNRSTAVTYAPQLPSVKQVESMPRKERLIPILSELLEEISGLDVNPKEVDVTFLEFGFDSLFLTQVSLMLKREFNVEITFRQILDEYATLNSLTAYIDSQLPEDAFPDETTVVPEIPVSAAPVSPLDILGMMPGELTAPGLDQSMLEKIVAQQLQIMAQQLALLQGGSMPAALPTVPPSPETKQHTLDETAVSPQEINVKPPTPLPTASAKANQPPVPGARLGRDADGNPAWFVADPEREGKYLQVQIEADA